MPMRMEAHCRINGHRHDLNMKGAYLHMLADTLVSVGVVVSGVLILLTRWQWLDQIIGLVIAAIYGANASGKSNLIQALTAIQSVVLHSGVGDREAALMIEPFALSEKTLGEPVSFELEMIASGRRYRYGFECTRDEIVWMCDGKFFVVPSRY